MRKAVPIIQFNLMRSRSLLVVIAVLAAAAILVGYVYTHRQKDSAIRGSGTIEATDVDVSFQIAGRVIEVLAVEGQAVKAGEVLARISSDELVQRVNQLQAALDAAASQVRQQQGTVRLRRDIVEGQIEQARGEAQASRVAADRVREGLRPQEVRVAEAELAQADARLTQSRADYERTSNLFKEGVVPRQQLDAAQGELRTAESAREAANQRLALAREGSRRQDIAEADARAETAQAGVNVAQAGRTDVEIQQAALTAAQAREKELRAQLEAAKTQLSYT